jgi:lipopolysaccharide cholinephosphotransferase
MGQNTLIKLRSVMLELLDEFVRICDENNLVYFLTAGTLLGAVRHKGFIPWDDDMDIAMPRNDYEKFLDICDMDDASNYYALSNRSPNNAVHHNKQFAKFCKKGTVYVESNVDPNRYSGIFIDIFPYDKCILFFAPLQTLLVKTALKLYLIKTHLYIPPKKIKLFIGKIFCLFLREQFLDMMLSKLYLLCNKLNTKHISFFSGRYGYKKETHQYDEIFPLAKIQFEGKHYCAPNNWDLFLKKLYGNYMELPPVEERISHHDPDTHSF